MLNHVFICVCVCVCAQEGAPFSWWVGGAGPGQSQTSWGGALTGTQQCGCSLQDSCLDPSHDCNCDADYDQWYCTLELQM